MYNCFKLVKNHYLDWYSMLVEFQKEHSAIHTIKTWIVTEKRIRNILKDYAVHLSFVAVAF